MTGTELAVAVLLLVFAATSIGFGIVALATQYRDRRPLVEVVGFGD